ncbi:DUF5320 domain-containing protein [Melioribacter sp. OK-6-Me]|uniref:DUF5320 domain-containing protein n=1 Tax=unclassified Melioribacter TaxID=2627329 RepID=UPI003EDA5079
MPGFDHTGPMGRGPLTGRRRGRCFDTQTTQTEKTAAQSSENKEEVYGLGRGGRPRGGAGNRFRSGCGKGGGRGRGRRFVNR